MDFLDYVEREAKENIRFHLDTLETLNKEAHTLLGLQLVFASAAFGYALKMAEPGEPVALAVGAVVLTAWLGALAALTAVRCLMHAPVEAPANEPENLLLDGVELDALRLAELDNVQVRIDRNQSRNAETGRALNTLRLLTIVSPLVFGLAAAVTSPFA